MQPRSLTHLFRLVCLCLVVLGLIIAIAAPVWAASYRNHIARIPVIPYPNGAARIWMDSDTAWGETAGVEYNIVGTGTYVRIYGTYDNTSYPGANWYADIPAFPVGTEIRYQLFTRNESGIDYDFTGFNWNYTVRTLPQHVVRDPDFPYPNQTVRVWMNSATVPGETETAGVEYNLVGTGTYVKVLGTYDDDTEPGANWYANIPAFPAGTEVRYQLFTRHEDNEVVIDYGYTDFNWSYTVLDLPQHIVQLPTTPIYTQSPRVWINSTVTPPGEAGVLRFTPGAPISYTGTYSPTGYTGANWYVDLPPMPAATFVQYHLYSLTPEGMLNTTIAGWNYTTADLPDTVYVDDSWAGAASGSDLGQPGVYNFGGNAFATVQGGVTGVAASGSVDVYDGVYTENIVITKSLILAGTITSDTVLIRPALPAPAPCTDSPLCGGEASNLILVQASYVTIHTLTLDGDNPELNGIDVGGANVDARNGIIENYELPTPFNNLRVYDTTIRNIYLRGLYASSGGDGFDFHENTVQNVQGTAQSIAIMNFGGSGYIGYNMVTQANDAIAANWSRGTLIEYNSVTASSSGVHTDNNGGWDGSADMLEHNTVSNCAPNGYGVWVFAPYRDVAVNGNTITGCAVGLAVMGQGASSRPQFAYNTVNGQSLPDSVGIYVTTSQFSGGDTNVSASFDSNIILNAQTGVYLEQITHTLNTLLTRNTLTANPTGLEMTGGDVTVSGNTINNSSIVITQSNGTLTAYANNFNDYTTAVNRSGGTAYLAHNWWDTNSAQPANVSAADWQARLGAENWAWAEGTDGAVLGNDVLTATLTANTGGTGTAVIVNHGSSFVNAPFGNTIFDFDSMCSPYYDFFTVNGSGTWDVSVPVDISVEGCLTQTLEPGKIYWIPADTDYGIECTPSDNMACWDLITTNVITAGQNISVTGLNTTQLGGTQFVAGTRTGDDPTAVTLIALAATTDRSSAPAGAILFSVLVATVGIILVVRRRR